MEDNPESKAIQKALNYYLDGTATNQPDMIVKAFYDEADLFLSKKDQPIYRLRPDEYAAFFGKKDIGKPNGRTGKIINIDIHNDIALATAEIEIPNREMQFIDVFIMKKLEGEWKIISKAATRLK